MLSQKLPSLIIMTLVFVFTLAARADASPSSSVALGFKAWKEQQILLAQNRLLRATAELESTKGTLGPKETSTEKTSKSPKALQRFQRSNDKSGMDRLENELQLAKESVQTANELTLDDYITIYLPTLHQNPTALDALMESMSKEEVSSILREILRKQSDQKEKASTSAAKLSGFWAGQGSSGK